MLLNTLTSTASASRSVSAMTSAVSIDASMAAAAAQPPAPPLSVRAVVDGGGGGAPTAAAAGDAAGTTPRFKGSIAAALGGVPADVPGVVAALSKVGVNSVDVLKIMPTGVIAMVIASTGVSLAESNRAATHPRAASTREPILTTENAPEPYTRQTIPSPRQAYAYAARLAPALAQRAPLASRLARGGVRGRQCGYGGPGSGAPTSMRQCRQ